MIGPFRLLVFTALFLGALFSAPTRAASPPACPLDPLVQALDEELSLESQPQPNYGKLAAPEEVDAYKPEDIYEMLGVLRLDVPIPIGAEKIVLKAIHEESLTEAAVLQSATALALSDLGIVSEQGIGDFLSALPKKDALTQRQFTRKVQERALYLFGLDILDGNDKTLTQRSRELDAFFSPLETDLPTVRETWKGRVPEIERHASQFIGFLANRSGHLDEWPTLLASEIQSAKQGKIRSALAYKMEFLAWAALDQSTPRALPDAHNKTPRTRVRVGFFDRRNLYVRDEIRDLVKQLKFGERFVAGTVSSVMAGINYFEAWQGGASSAVQLGSTLAAGIIGYGIVGLKTAARDMTSLVRYLKNNPNSYSMDDIQYVIGSLPPIYRFAAKIEAAELGGRAARIDVLPHMVILTMANKLESPPTLSELSWLLKKLMTSENRVYLVDSLRARFPGVHFESMIAALRDHQGKNWVRVVNGDRIRYFPREVAQETIATAAESGPAGPPRYRIAPDLDRPLDLPDSELDEWEEEFVSGTGDKVRHVQSRQSE